MSTRITTAMVSIQEKDNGRYSVKVNDIEVSHLATNAIIRIDANSLPSIEIEFALPKIDTTVTGQLVANFELTPYSYELLEALKTQVEERLREIECEGHRGCKSL